MRARIAAALAFVLLAAFALPAGSQDEKPKNLKILPKNMSGGEVRTIMRGYASALGVGCVYCHVQDADHSFKFDADDKRPKLVAREMMRLTSDINTRVLANLKDRPKPAVNVECMTCHRGVTRPRMLGDVIVDSLNTGGLDSARTALCPAQGALLWPLVLRLRRTRADHDRDQAERGRQVPGGARRPQARRGAVSGLGEHRGQRGGRAHRDGGHRGRAQRLQDGGRARLDEHVGEVPPQAVRPEVITPRADARG